MTRALFLCLIKLLPAAALLASTTLALARPGGGHTFSSPDDSDGGGGGGDGAIPLELVVFIIRLIVHYPKVMIPLLIIVFVIWKKSQRFKLENWDAPHHAHGGAAANRVQSARQPAGQRPAAGLDRLRQVDADFSQVLFEDFAYRLYASVQRARPNAAALAALTPYLSEAVRGELLRTDWQSVSQVVVGALRVEGCEVPSDPEQPARMRLAYEANLTTTSDGSAQTLYVRERWQLERAQSARSKAPGGYERLGCPNCGAPFRSSDNRRCEYCGQVVSDGRFNWAVMRRDVLSEEHVPPALTGHVEERGTNLRTLFAPNYNEAWTTLCRKDPALNDVAFNRRVELIYGQLNSAWSSLELSSARALLSDGMFDYLSYWVEAYRAQGLRNVLEKMRIVRVELVKVSSDPFFDAVTVRLFATGRDYTVRAANGELVSGSQTRERVYSEYWTLIRGAATRGAPRAEASCPNCAAPLKASMAGTCAYCSAHVTSGEFDWVLSKIEQDDVYDG